MKNYITTSSEYDIVIRRLNRLYDRKEKLIDNIHKITSQLKDVVVNTGFTNDKMSIYVAELEEIENEIKEKEIEAKELKEDLEYMDSRLSNIEDTKEQVFVKYFIKGMKPKHIAPSIPRDISTVYKKIKEINEERKVAKQIQTYYVKIICVEL